jgi:hypothetical protein
MCHELFGPQWRHSVFPGSSLPQPSGAALVTVSGFACIPRRIWGPSRPGYNANKTLSKLFISNPANWRNAGWHCFLVGDLGSVGCPAARHVCMYEDILHEVCWMSHVTLNFCSNWAATYVQDTDLWLCDMRTTKHSWRYNMPSFI